MATQTSQISREFRDVADKGVDQARNAFGTLLSGAIKTSEQFQVTSATVHSTVQAAIQKGFDHAQANAAATFDYAQRLARAKDLREAFEIQSEFVQTQFSALQSQVRDFGALVEKTKH